MRSISLFGFAFLFSTYVYAATIQQILAQENKAALALTPEDKFKAGDVLLATHESKNCPIKILSIENGYALADLSRCSFKRELKIGDKVEASLIPVKDEPADTEDAEMLENADNSKSEKANSANAKKADTAFVATSSPTEKSYRWGGAVYYSTADTLKFDSLRVTTASGSGSGTFDFKMSGAVGLDISFTTMTRNSWGFIGSAHYEAARKIKSFTVSGVNGTATYSGDNGPNLSFFFLEGNAVYRWENFYLPFGFNYSFPDLTNFGGTGQVTYNGGVGADISVGYFINENFAVEAWSRALMVKLNIDSGTNHIDFGNGLLTGLGLGVKYWF